MECTRGGGGGGGGAICQGGEFIQIFHNGDIFRREKILSGKYFH